MNTATILSSIVTILSADSSLNSWTREITTDYIEVPYLKGTYANIFIIAGEPEIHPRPTMNRRRYNLPVIIMLEQRKAKMTDSEIELNKIVDKIIDVIESNRKNITGVNGIDSINIGKEFDSTEVDTRQTQVTLTLDILE